MRSLVTSALGRPVRTTGLTASHWASVNGNASGSLIDAAVIAASSVSETGTWVGLSFGTAFHLALVRFSQADDSFVFATNNEDHLKQPITDVTKSGNACLTVVLALIRPCHRIQPFKTRSNSQRHAMLLSVLGDLGLVKLDAHLTYCMHTHFTVNGSGGRHVRSVQPRESAPETTFHHLVQSPCNTSPLTLATARNS